MTRAALYLRQSLDVQEGIERQRDRCTKLAEERGYEVIGVYEDNDVSAGKTRGPKTQWARLIADAEAKKFDVVISVDMDRLLRSLRDLLTIIGTRVAVLTVNGEIDLTTADGTFRATMLAGVAEFEIRRKSERQKTANAGGRAKGKPPVGRRAFGYTSTKDGHKPKEPQAQAVRDAYERASHDESLGSITRGLNADGFTTTTGRPWSPDTVRALLTNPRYVAKIGEPRKGAGNAASRYDLSALQDGNWTPLVDLETWSAVQTILRNPLRQITTKGSQKLLSGLARCAVCGGPMRSGATSGVRLYRCSAPGSAHLSVKAEPIEEYVTTLVLDRLRAAGVGILYTDPDAAKTLRASIRAVQTRQSELASLVADGTLTAAQVRPQLEGLSKEVRDLEEKAVDNTRYSIVGPLYAAGSTRAYWDTMAIDQQRAVISLFASITLQSPGKGARGRPERAVVLDFKISEQGKG